MAHSVIKFPDHVTDSDCIGDREIAFAAQRILTAAAERPVPIEIQNLIRALGEAIDADGNQPSDPPEIR